MFFFFRKYFKLFKLIGNDYLFKIFFLKWYMYKFNYRFSKIVNSFKYKYNSKFFKFYKKLIKLKDRRYKKKRKLFRRRLSFIFNKKRTGILKLRTTSSNFFITLTDLDHSVLKSMSTGIISNSRMRKKKMSPYLIPFMMKKVKKKILKYKIRNLIIHVNSNINKHMHNVFNYLKNFNYCRIKAVGFFKPIPHQYGQRKKKARRL